MKASRTIAWALALTTLGGGASAAPTALASLSAGPAFDPTVPRIIVQFTDLPADARARFAAVGITYAAYFPSVNAAAVAGPEEAYAAISRWDDVLDVHPDAPLNLYIDQAATTTRADLVRVGAKPLKTAYTGKGITVAVIDSGVDTNHPDLDAGKVTANYDFTPSAIFDPTRGNPPDLGAWEPLMGDPVAMPVGVDESVHGTWLAGAVAGTGEAALGADLRGLAPDALLVNLDIIGPGGAGSVSSAVAAFEWLVEHRDDPRFPGGIRVAVSGTGAECPPLCDLPALRRAIGAAIDAGVIVVFPAAGTSLGDDVVLPGRYPEVIGVRGACKDQDDWSAVCKQDRTFDEFSSASIDLVAPGYAVWLPAPPHSHDRVLEMPGLVCQVCGYGPVPGGSTPEHAINNELWYTATYSHSVATAHLAGVASLMLEATPRLTQRDVERILHETARDLGPDGFDPRTGYGMVDALRAVRTAELAPPAPARSESHPEP